MESSTKEVHKSYFHFAVIRQRFGVDWRRKGANSPEKWMGFPEKWDEFLRKGVVKFTVACRGSQCR